MSRLAPFEGVRLLLVDGNNLLHRTAAGPGPVGARILLARLRAAMPPGMEAIVVLDGPPDPGAPMREAAGPNVEIRHAGRHSADDVIVRLVQERPPFERARVVAVSDDRALRDRVTGLGGIARRLDWIESSLALPPRGPRAPAGSSIASARPPRSAPGKPGPGMGQGAAKGAEEDPDESARPRWQPGRGATRKRGNAHRGRPDR